MNLILKLLAGMVAGILLGLFAPAWPVRTLLTVTEIVGQLIKFTIPLIILFYITSGIASLPRDSGKLLGRTVGFAYGSTLVAGILAFLAAAVLLPVFSPAAGATGQGAALTPWFTLAVPPLFGVISALVAAFVFGTGISALRAETLRTLFEQGRDVIERLLGKVIIPLLPLYIAGVFAGMAADGSVFTTLKAFGVVLVMVIVMHWAWLSVLYVVTGLMTGRSPLGLVRTMLPAYFTALGTMSSAATIPVTLRQVKALPVREPIANFTVPLCANIHLSGSTITLVTCATAVMLLTPGVDIPGLGAMLPFILMLGVIMVAAPGAPGGAVMAALGLLTSMLGFNETQVALMIALYLAQDSFGTATNVTGDGVIAVWMDKFFGDQVAAAKPDGAA
ncbi:MAG: dicarboxylate/amino acid:cation symporter [Opitutaceae bacterium]|nr:dicarboxylate/amino acid:cation symporter [Opitutaceae bacterium]